MRTVISALFLCFSLAATAQEVPDFDVHGFASYTLANAPKHDIGLGVSYRNDYFDVQGLLMDTRDGPYQLSGIRYLYVETQKKLGEASAAGLRVGRVRHLLGFHNLKRENPRDADYIWRPPAIYREQAAHMATSGDGAQGYVKVPVAEWDVGVNLTHVKPVLEPMKESVAIIFGDNQVGTFSGDSRITGVNLSVASPDHRLELRYGYTRLNLDFHPSPVLFFLTPGFTDTQMHTFGARYYITDDFDVTVERIKVRNKGAAVWDSFHAVWPVQGDPGGYALTFRWRPSDRTQVAFTADKWCTDESDCAGRRGAGFNIPSHAFYSKSYTAALRYRIDEHWATTLQVMRVEGSNTELSELPRRAATNRVGLRVSYSW